MGTGGKNATTAVVFALFFALFVALVAPRVLQVQKLSQRSETLEAELRRLKAENDQLEAELRLLKDDPVYLEKVARSQFNKAKEGEVVYKVVREGQNTR
jgi:cell division protein DivIC